jgi:hypothetical protein
MCAFIENQSEKFVFKIIFRALLMIVAGCLVAVG